MESNIKEIVAKRYDLNVEITFRIMDAVKLFPEMRFEQLMIALGITDPRQDYFYEEPDVTLARVTENLNKLMKK